MTKSSTLFVLVNHVDELGPQQTTTMLIAAAVRRGHKVAVVEVAGITARAANDLAFWGTPLLPADCDTNDSVVRFGREQTLCIHRVRPGDQVMVRTNPGRDNREGLHQLALEFLMMAVDVGVNVVNTPQGLSVAMSKLYLMRLPESVRPASIVSYRAEEIIEFVRGRLGKVVLKPVEGTRGRDVFVVRPDERANLNQIIDVLRRQGPVVAQDFAPGAEEGDVRAVLVDGEPLAIGTDVVAIRRTPPEGDFRSNVHIGGHPEATSLSPAQLATIETVGGQLVADGLRLVGLDLIGPMIIEVNVFSTGGYWATEVGTKKDFAGATVDRLFPLTSH